MKNRRRRMLLALSVLSLAAVGACEPAPPTNEAQPTPSQSSSAPAPGTTAPTPEDSPTQDPGTPDPTTPEPEPEPSTSAPEPEPSTSPSPTAAPSPTSGPTAAPSPSASPTSSPRPSQRPTPTPTPRPDDTGFTPVRPSSDSRLIYVSSSTGDDANPCTVTQPCKTLAKGTSLMRKGSPDHLYLKAGDVWTGESLGRTKSGRSATEPAVVTSYGQGPRPLLEVVPSGKYPLSFNTGSQGLIDSVWFIGLHIKNVHLDPDHPRFTGKKEDAGSSMFLGRHTNILLEDNVFDHYEVVFQNWETGNPENITIRRNIFTGAYVDTSSYSQSQRPSNMYLDGIINLTLEENVFDHGGWNPTAKGAGANMYNHNVYMQYSQFGETHVVRRNFFTRASSHGIQMRSGGLAEDNFFGRNAVSMLIGYGKDKPLGDANVHAFDNVVTEGQSMIKGHDHCQGPNLCTLAVWGIDLNAPPGHPVEARGNIVHSRTREKDEAWKVFSPRSRDLSVAAFKVYDRNVDYANLPAGVSRDNLLWHWVDGSQDTGNGSYPAPGRTLGDYFQHLRTTGALDELVKNGTVDRVRKGYDDFDSFLELLIHRAPGKWDERLSAAAVNDWIRAGFGR